MKSKLFTLAALSIASGLAFGQSGATAPTMNITSPTAAGGVIFLGAFPSTIPVSYTVQANGLAANGSAAQLKNLTNLDVTVNGVSLYGGAQNAFNNSNVCVGTAATSPNTCATSTSTQASLSALWTVPAVGDYTIVVTAKQQNALGMDEEFVTVAQLSAEYPAPPAVANAYINAGAGGLSLSGKQRGCVISKIAEQHGKFETYGAKGGPYNEALIQSAVINFAGACPTR